jgi:hypothetical protein
MSRMSRTAYGLESPRDEWSMGARCAESDVDMNWWTGGQEQGLARHVCWMHCPVREQCERDTPPERSRRRGTVWGGHVYNDHGRLAAIQPGVTRCPLCLPAEQRRELTEAMA